MSTQQFPRTQAIMIEVRKAVNASNVEKAIGYLEVAHDKVEELERNYLRLLGIAKELARLSTTMDAIPIGAIGTQVYALEQLEKQA